MTFINKYENYSLTKLLLEEDSLENDSTVLDFAESSNIYFDFLTKTINNSVKGSSEVHKKRALRVNTLVKLSKLIVKQFTDLYKELEELSEELDDSNLGAKKSYIILLYANYINNFIKTLAFMFSFADEYGRKHEEYSNVNFFKADFSDNEIVVNLETMSRDLVVELKSILENFEFKNIDKNMIKTLKSLEVSNPGKTFNKTKEVKDNLDKISNIFLSFCFEFGGRKFKNRFINNDKLKELIENVLFDSEKLILELTETIDNSDEVTKEELEDFYKKLKFDKQKTKTEKDSKKDVEQPKSVEDTEETSDEDVDEDVESDIPDNEGEEKHKEEESEKLRDETKTNQDSEQIPGEPESEPESEAESELSSEEEVEEPTEEPEKLKQIQDSTLDDDIDLEDKLEEPYHKKDDKFSKEYSIKNYFDYYDKYLPVDTIVLDDIINKSFNLFQRKIVRRGARRKLKNKINNALRQKGIKHILVENNFLTENEEVVFDFNRINKLAGINND